MTLHSLQNIAQALGGEVAGGQVLAPGPGHSPGDRSLSYKPAPGTPDGFVVHSFAGDDWIACKDHVRDRLGLQREFKRADAAPAGSYAPSATITRMADRVNKAKLGPLECSYDYPAADGTRYMLASRYRDPKDFRQLHWTGTDYAFGAPKGPKVPYRLPELIKAVHDTVFIVEGEKDADNLAARDFVATTNIGGASNWTSDLNEHFRGRRVFILPDNDDAGRKHAQKVATNLHGIASEVRILNLPGLPDKGDVSDWIDAGGDTSKLIAMAEAVPLWSPNQEGSDKSSQENFDQDFGDSEASGGTTRVPLPWLDMSAWDDAPIPERQWSIRDRVPLKQAGLFSGEGGTGKSIIELMKNVAHVAGKDWLGSMPELGPAFYLGAEDDKDEIHIRLAAIAKHYGTTFAELIQGGLHVLPLLGQDATLCAVTKGGNVEVTALYRQLYEAAGDIKPKNISIDTLSRAFAGNEIDRVQVYAFAMQMQALAMAAQGSVTILSHPSLQGINSGSGLSGSTAWHGAFRFRQYLKGVKASDGEQPENDLRQLEFKKNQYGPMGDTLVLRYQNGLFLPEAGVSDFDKAARSAKAQDVFMTLLRRFSDEDRNVSDKATAPNYAPTAFAKEDEAQKYRLRKADLERAMRDLFKASRIELVNYGRPSRPSYRLAVKG